jgi:hypothetical protein
VEGGRRCANSDDKESMRHLQLLFLADPIYLKVMRLLSPLEEAYLNCTGVFTETQQRYICYRLKKKLRLLDESRDAAAARLLRRSRVDNNDNNSGLVAAQLAERSFADTIIGNYNENKSPRWDLNPRPKVFAPTTPLLFLERRFTKPSLCQLSY